MTIGIRRIIGAQCDNTCFQYTISEYVLLDIIVFRMSILLRVMIEFTLPIDKSLFRVQ